MVVSPEDEERLRVVSLFEKLGIQREMELLALKQLAKIEEQASEIKKLRDELERRKKWGWLLGALIGVMGTVGRFFLEYWEMLKSPPHAGE